MHKTMFENFLYQKVAPRKNLYLFMALIVFLVLLVSFLLLMVAVLNNQTSSFDFEFMGRVQSFSNAGITSIMVYTSFFGELFIAPLTFLAIITLLYFKGYRREMLATSLIWFGPFLSSVSKSFVARPRPLQFSLGLDYPVPTDFSFPSGHVVFYTVLFGILVFYAITLPNLSNIWRFSLLAVSLPLIILVGASRVYLGAHWPSDVIAGYLLGFALLEVLVLVYFKFIYLPQMRYKQNQTHRNSKQ